MKHDKSKIEESMRDVQSYSRIFVMSKLDE